MDNIERLKALLEVANNGVTKSEFLDSFKNLMSVVSKIYKQIKSASDALENKYSDFISKIDTKTEKSLKDITNRLDKKELELTQKVDEKLLEIRDGIDGEDGKDADEQYIIEQVKQQIHIPTVDELRNDIPKLAEQIRDSLELLNGDERLRMDAIAGLKEALEELKQIKGKVGGGGGFSYMAMDLHIVDDETPTGTVNGVNTDFVIAGTPNPASSLKVYVNGQRMRVTEDYTFSGRTITFITAPGTGSVILVDYRI